MHNSRMACDNKVFIILKTYNYNTQQNYNVKQVTIICYSPVSNFRSVFCFDHREAEDGGIENWNLQ